ncbi:tubulin-like doman-containing protein [Corynebacterium neomassiliense]|uniref:tubulin-like doman-containing protein n=1 Tax=Corynebacterium neomassiliense TaxID=2079482 RepID=UPI001031A5EE|nr:tubulin-like doman-containing protein [Corynebacterium neomassiliense]
MKKFLVVGCGGSGAKTQAYMIDQLKAHLRSFDPTLTTLPKAWQFVSVDVPIDPEKGPDGLGNVQVNGGRYVGIGSKEQYRTFDSGITRMLGDRKALGEVATWAERHPENRTTPISDGAGQFRGLGRMLTLRAIPRIRDELKAAMDVLEESSTISELDELNRRITGHHQSTQDSSPVILVISSMAGGAGASMFLDVCRILSTLPNAKPEHTGVFMYTPEVFESLPADSMVGAWPNALAMFGEAVATQTGTATDSDVALFRALGVNAGGSRNTFARLFPIGARMGATGARFGDGSPETVYRGLGRSLAALMTSEKSAESFVSYSLGNTGSPEADRSLLGWASTTDMPWDVMPWGSMGYAQLSMGRDRYAEYAAQRLARAAFDRLLEGHLDPESTDTGEEQLKKRLHERYPRILDRIGLGAAILTEQPNQNFIAQWVSYLSGNAATPAVEQSRRWLRQRLPAAEGMKASDWGSLVRSRLTDPRTGHEVSTQLRSAAYSFVYSFADLFCDHVIKAAEENLASVGLPFVEQVVGQLGDDILQRLVRPLADFANANAHVDPVAMNAQVEQMLQPVTGNGAVTNAGQILDNIAAQYRNQFFNSFFVYVAGNLYRVLEDFTDNVLKRLGSELSDAHADLEHANRQTDPDTRLADVATDDPVAWPGDRDEMISDRFRGSANEILISDVDHFPSDYETHILQDVKVSDPEVFSARQASLTAAQSVIRGSWQTNGSEKAPEDTLAMSASRRTGGNRCGWVSRYLATPPNGGDERESRPGTFTAKIRPAELLRRARMWIQRPDYHFQRFISTDLRSYMTQDETTNDVTFERRMSRLRAAFSTALAQARPLAAVDSAMVSLVHNTPESYHYNFSEIPFKARSAAEELRSVLNGTTNLDESTPGALESALTQGTKIRHIDVFGSYPNYSPVVFSSLFPPIAKEWDSRTSHDGFWTLRRSRPLAGAVPLSRAERQAMVGGWIIGSITGRIYIQDQGQPTAHAHVYDDEAQEWVSFPHPLLTPPSQFRAQLDWMPAIIESVLLAYANIQNQDAQGRLAQSLRPYHLLRGLFDDSPSGPTTGVTRHPSVSRIAAFLRTGERPGQPVAGTSVDDRYQLFLSQLDQASKNADIFLPGAGSGLPGAQSGDKPWAEVADRGHASSMPFYRDLAPDVRDMVKVLKDSLSSARTEAEHPDSSGTLLPGVGAETPFPDLGTGVI